MVSCTCTKYFKYLVRGLSEFEVSPLSNFRYMLNIESLSNLIGFVE